MLRLLQSAAAAAEWSFIDSSDKKKNYCIMVFLSRDVDKTSKHPLHHFSRGTAQVMPMVGSYFVGLVTPVSSAQQSYWNDETRETLRNDFNREMMDDEAFIAEKDAHQANVAHTMAVRLRRDKVIAAVKEAKARSQATADAMNNAIIAANRIAVLGTTTNYMRFFQSMGLMPCRYHYGADAYNDDDDILSMANAHLEFEEKYNKMEALQHDNLRIHCKDVLNRRFGDNVAKLVGDVNRDYVLRVRTGKKWITTCFPKTELSEWRQRIKDADVADEIRRIYLARGR